MDTTQNLRLSAEEDRKATETQPRSRYSATHAFFTRVDASSASPLMWKTSTDSVLLCSLALKHNQSGAGCT